MPPWRLWPRCSAPWRRPLPRRTCCRSGCRRYSGQAGRWRRPWTAPRCHGGYGSRPPPAVSADPQVSILGLLEQPLSFGSASVFALDSTWVPGTALPQQRQQLALDRELAESDAVHCCLCAGRAACCVGRPHPHLGCSFRCRNTTTGPVPRHHLCDPCTGALPDIWRRHAGCLAWQQGCATAAAPHHCRPVPDARVPGACRGGGHAVPGAAAATRAPRRAGHAAGGASGALPPRRPAGAPPARSRTPPWEWVRRCGRTPPLSGRVLGGGGWGGVPSGGSEKAGSGERRRPFATVPAACPGPVACPAGIPAGTPEAACKTSISGEPDQLRTGLERGPGSAACWAGEGN